MCSGHGEDEKRAISRTALWAIIAVVVIVIVVGGVAAYYATRRLRRSQLPPRPMQSWGKSPSVWPPISPGMGP
ncbi:MAG: hypothetical protein ACP5G6_04085 [Conexivisphaera sp.]